MISIKCKVIIYNGKLLMQVHNRIVIVLSYFPKHAFLVFYFYFCITFSRLAYNKSALVSKKCTEQKQIYAQMSVRKCLSVHCNSNLQVGWYLHPMSDHHFSDGGFWLPLEAMPIISHFHQKY